MPLRRRRGGGWGGKAAAAAAAAGTREDTQAGRQRQAALPRSCLVADVARWRTDRVPRVWVVAFPHPLLPAPSSLPPLPLPPSLLPASSALSAAPGCAARPRCRSTCSGSPPPACAWASRAGPAGCEVGVACGLGSPGPCVATHWNQLAAWVHAGTRGGPFVCAMVLLKGTSSPTAPCEPCVR